MLRKVDLHQYSTWSQGESEPRDLVDRAVRLGLGAIAITDLASDAAYIDASAYGMQNSVEVLRATLLPVEHDGALFTVIVYGANPSTAQWRKLIRAERKAHMQRVAGIVAKSRGKQDEVVVPWGQLAQVAGIAHEAGGVASLAYPGAYGSHKKSIMSVIESMQQVGLDAIEAFSPLHHPAFIDDLVQFANAHGLLITGGSAHGMSHIKTARNRGTIYLPHRYYAALKERIDKNYDK